MSEYLSKEEIKQWRSSLEKITLEEFAARLGKKIEEAKPTNDLVDIVLKGQPVVSTSEDWLHNRGERLSTIAERAMLREREISPTPFSIGKLKLDDNLKKEEKKALSKSKSVKSATAEKTTTKTAKPAKSTKSTTKKSTAKTTAKVVKTKTVVEQVKTDNLREDVRIVFKKALTDREQKVFDHFCEHSNKIVYAKDLAALLDLPRDYVYKYIKNLRAKIDGDNLQNADKGGFILNV